MPDGLRLLGTQKSQIQVGPPVPMGHPLRLGLALERLPRRRLWEARLGAGLSGGIKAGRAGLALLLGYRLPRQEALADPPGPGSSLSWRGCFPGEWGSSRTDEAWGTWPRPPPRLPSPPARER